MHFEKLPLLINLSEKVLNREEVVGQKLNKDIPAITAIQASMLEGSKESDLNIIKKYI
ncbi:hypothetical protein [Clostridium sp. Marseille-Q2269]|uniref:hypothetical protein n=1 Tax=Clostridium sp. Marseille-Q2269 TaxID=2942205 RepID=UPI00207310DB|nr:hypothetical protein [Clostridium sp. Marseille-Q2269]